MKSSWGGVPDVECRGGEGAADALFGARIVSAPNGRSECDARGSDGWVSP